jgi:hypothetical protein
MEWAFVTFEAIPIVERILSLGLYCVLTLASDMGYDPTTLHIQNSWGKTVDSVSKASFPAITLGSQKFRCERIQTVFPMPGFELPSLQEH